MKKFDVNTIPDLSGKTILITGGTAGLGANTLKVLAKHNPSHLIFTGRNEKSAQLLLEELQAAASSAKVIFVKCDLASFASIDVAADQIKAAAQRLDILICNAGIMAVPPALTIDGYEIQFGVNHLGHALLIKHLLPTLVRTFKTYGDARIISLTSIGFHITPPNGIVFSELRTTQEGGMGFGWKRYGQSKLAVVLYGAELAKRYPSLTVAVIHPGVIATDLVNNLGLLNKAIVYATASRKMVKPEEGVWNSLWAATTDKKNVKSGAFYEPVGELGKQSKFSVDTKLQAELWEYTQKQLQGRGE
ncbi:MAG: hypothetical protein Q9175_007130 [Cornicularia normoerica]